MSSMSRGLGRGLDALFQHGEVEATSVRTPSAPRDELALEALFPNPQQPRRQFVDAQLEELTSSIKAQGILQPILVRPRTGEPGTYEIVAGERRWRAAKAAGLHVVPVVVKDMNDQEVLVVALMENLQREDLTPLEEAMGLQQLKEEFGLSQEDMAGRLGKSRSAIANTLRLLLLPEKARQNLAEGTISAGHARALLMVADPESQEFFRQHMVSSHCTVRDAERIAAHWKEYGALPDDFAQSGGKKPATSSSAPLPLHESLVTIQARLSKALALPVTIKGKETKGKISLTYGSKEELDALLERLGIAGEHTDA